MLVLQILGAIALIWGVLAALRWFDKRCHEKFSYRFLTTKNFCITAGSMALLVFGNWWRTSAIESGGDALNGIILMGFGVVLAIGLAYINFKRTNMTYGIGGTALQMSVFGLLAMAGVFVLILGLIAWFLGRADAQPVYVVD